MPHLVADITAHGFGHLVQSALVFNALWRMRPDIKLTVRCNHSRRVLEEFIVRPFETAPSLPDVGMIMLGPSRIDAQASLGAYQDIFRDWDQLVERETSSLAELNTDLHFTNIGFAGIAAAHSAGVKSIGLCSLNWLDIFSSYCIDLSGGREIAEKLQRIYAQLDMFIQPTPAMQMSQFTRFKSVGPIARDCKEHLTQRSAELRERFAQPYLALASVGGIPMDTGWDLLPRVDGVFWLTPGNAPKGRDDVADCETLGVKVIEALCASDLVLTKTGYGTFAEAVCNGIRLLYAARPDWPEATALEGWVNDHGCTAHCSQDQLYSGDFADQVKDLLGREPAARISPTGAEEAARILADAL